MKREILGTLLILMIVINGIMNTISKVENNQAKKNHNFDAYSELISEKLIFDDEFSGKLNKNWQLQDNEAKYNRISMNEKKNVEFENNQCLKLVTRQEADKSITTPYLTVAKDDLQNYFNYGYYEARIKFTNNNNLGANESQFEATNILKPWGAFWLYPLAEATDNSTEVDIVENAITNVASASVHELSNYEVVEQNKASTWFKGNDYQVNPLKYHRYGVYIEPNQYENAASYTFYLDGKKVTKVVSKHPMGNQTIHLSMEMATSDYKDGLQGKPIEAIKNMQDEAMYVDYVRVYAYNENM